jgi:hypothetical protein
MSAGRLALWDEFVTNLEAEAGVHYKKSWKWTQDVRAQRACTTLRNGHGRSFFLDAVGKALTPERASQDLPTATQELASIRWPLVVSTNYDDLFFGACGGFGTAESQQAPKDEMPVQVMGRSANDCKVVLSSLYGPFDRRYIWHVQGFLGGQFGAGIETKVEDLEALRNQLVVGHAEYRLAANASPHFRRCFGEMFRSRSFLFLGSNLTEEYFLNLFGEVLDLCGPSHIPHFAFSKKGTVNAHFLADQMNITVCEFDSYDELPKRLRLLRQAIENPESRNTGWSFTVGPDPKTRNDLSIVREAAPLRPGPHEVIAIVARRDLQDDRPVLEPPYAELAREYPLLCFNDRHIVKYGDLEIYAVTALCRENEDDSAVDDAVSELLNEIAGGARHAHARHGHKEPTVVHLQLSSTGGSVPPVFAFMRVVRAFGKWKKEKRHKHNPLQLIVHIQSAVEFNLTSGRIDVQELLSSELIRFWTVVSSEPDKDPARRVLYYKEETALPEVLEDLGVPFGPDLAEWSLSVCPSPKKMPEKTTTWSLQDKAPTLLSIGVVFGSVLTLECVTSPDGPH